MSATSSATSAASPTTRTCRANLQDLYQVPGVAETGQPAPHQGALLPQPHHDQSNRRCSRWTGSRPRRPARSREAVVVIVAIRQAIAWAECPPLACRPSPRKGGEKPRSKPKPQSRADDAGLSPSSLVVGGVGEGPFLRRSPEYAEVVSYSRHQMSAGSIAADSSFRRRCVALVVSGGKASSAKNPVSMISRSGIFGPVWRTLSQR